MLRSLLWCLPQLYASRDDDDDCNQYIQAGLQAIRRELQNRSDGHEAGLTLLNQAHYGPSTAEQPGGAQLSVSSGGSQSKPAQTGTTHNTLFDTLNTLFDDSFRGEGNRITSLSCREHSVAVCPLPA